MPKKIAIQCVPGSPPSSVFMINKQGFETELLWNQDYELPERKIVSRIYTEMLGISYHNPDNWTELFKFMATNMLLLQSNFELIEDIFKEKFGK